MEGSRGSMRKVLRSGPTSECKLAEKKKGTSSIPFGTIIAGGICETLYARDR